jgi:hypothetical protein
MGTLFTTTFLVNILKNETLALVSNLFFKNAHPPFYNLFLMIPSVISQEQIKNKKFGANLYAL